MNPKSSALAREIGLCRLCAAEFAASATAHEPRPVLWYGRRARILIAGQAPGARVHASGKPFTDPSGDRLRDWLGLDAGTFYDRGRISILPMAFCFPGYDTRGADLPPPARCARTWRARLLADMTGLRLTLLVGGHAQKWHLPETAGLGVTARVRRWREFGDVIPLPHPSWRNNAWLARNPWFERDLLPNLKLRVRNALHG